jgi:hypothetical protein
MELYKTLRFNCIPTELIRTVVRIKTLKENENKKNKKTRNIQGEGIAGVGIGEVKKSTKRTTSLCCSVLPYKNCRLPNDIQMILNTSNDLSKCLHTFKER